MLPLTQGPQPESMPAGACSFHAASLLYQRNLGFAVGESLLPLHIPRFRTIGGKFSQRVYISSITMAAAGNAHKSAACGGPWLVRHSRAVSNSAVFTMPSGKQKTGCHFLSDRSCMAKMQTFRRNEAFWNGAMDTIVQKEGSRHLPRSQQSGVMHTQRLSLSMNSSVMVESAAKASTNRSRVSQYCMMLPWVLS